MMSRQSLFAVATNLLPAAAGNAHAQPNKCLAGKTKVTLTLSKRLRVMRHRTTRWFLPPPGRRVADAPYEYEREIKA